MLSVKTFVKGGFALSFVADLWNNENTKMKMQTKAILKTTICFFLFFPCLYYLYLFDENIFICRQRYITLRKNMFLKYINRQLWGKCGEKLDN